MVVYQTRYQNKIQQQYSRNSHSRRHWRKFWQLWLDPLRILCENVLCSHGWTLKGRSSWLSGEGTFSFLKNETGKTAFKVSVSSCIPIRNKRELLLMPGFDSAAREQMHILPPTPIGRWWQTGTSDRTGVTYRAQEGVTYRRVDDAKAVTVWLSVNFSIGTGVT